MIELNRLDSTVFFLNVTHVVTVETTPDTVITLLGGQKIRVRQKSQDVCAAIDAWFQRVGTRAVVPLPPQTGGNMPDDDKED